MNPPEIRLEVSKLSLAAGDRHEAMVDLLGRYIMWLRNSAVERSRRIVGESDAKELLGLARWKRFDGVAKMTREGQSAACELAEATVDRFIELLLTLLAGTGVDLRIDQSHAVRFRLDLEIVDVESDEVILTETVNRGGEKFFVNYWGRWLNRAVVAQPTSSTRDEAESRGEFNGTAGAT